jgi:hypothetical protein
MRDCNIRPSLSATLMPATLRPTTDTSEGGDPVTPERALVIGILALVFIALLIVVL